MKKNYRSRCGDILCKEPPPMPAVQTGKDFRTFFQAVRTLAHRHLNY